MSTSKAAVSTYVIAGTARTGSTLLCDSLAETNIAGRPTEVAPFLYEDASDECLLTLVRKGTTDNGVFGAKLHWNQVEWLVRDRYPATDNDGLLERLLPGAKYIHLTRRDIRAQAISLYRALATNVWWRRSGNANSHTTGSDPEFDSHAIRRLEHDVGRQDAAWREFFRRRAIVPLVLEYETLVSHRAEEVARVLRFIGQQPAAALTLPPPRLLRQADSKTAQWRRLMDAEDSLTTDGE